MRGRGTSNDSRLPRPPSPQPSPGGRGSNTKTSLPRVGAGALLVRFWEHLLAVLANVAAGDGVAGALRQICIRNARARAPPLFASLAPTAPSIGGVVDFVAVSR